MKNIKQLLEIEDGSKPSKYEDTKIEDLFDFIVMHIDHMLSNKKEYRGTIKEAIRLFGQKRFNQGVREAVKYYELKD